MPTPRSLLPILVSLAAPFVSAQANPAVVSEVDTSLRGASKYVLRVDGRPFYPVEVQVRLDKLRYWWGWDARAREALVAQAARDGFNTVSLPIQWYEVETAKDRFDWAILDEYLSTASRHGLKVELLWFGQNSGGHVQWLGDEKSKDPVHLRVPDYVLYSPGPGSRETTSEYRIRREMSDYTLDLADGRLGAREARVLGAVMAHVAEWDRDHGAPHAVIGIQLGNEVHGLNGVPMPAALDVAYYGRLGAVVKNGPYRVWTRMNCVWIDAASRIFENERLREKAGTGLDFVGTDLYRNDGNGISTVRAEMPYAGLNYRMIMECGAEDSVADLCQLAALAGNNAVDLYDYCSPDGHGLYDRNGLTGFAPHAATTIAIRSINRMLLAANADLATRAQGHGLFVHNWDGGGQDGTAGVAGIRFHPKSPRSQAVSIEHDSASVAIMTTLGGTFSWPASLDVLEAGEGAFTGPDGRWENRRRLMISGRSLELSAGEVALLRTARESESPREVLQAEFARLGGAAAVEASADCLGFAGNGYVRFHRAGESVSWPLLDGLGGGTRRIAFRYANGTPQNWEACVFVNGEPHKVLFPPTGAWDKYGTVEIKAPLLPGPVNGLSLETAGEGDCHLDELQVF